MAKATISKPVQKAATKKPVVVEKPMGRYINPLTDFGFKHIFGTKEFLKDFLNAVLRIDGGIVNLHYDNTERPGRTEEDRTTIFDLYCTLKSGEHIIIEMQYHRHENFKERTMYYASRLIQEQGEDKIGDIKWKFALSPVYSVNIVNFKLDPKKKKRDTNKYASYVQLYDIETGEVFYNKLKFVFLELPYFTKKENDLPNYIDWWMYALKNMATLDHLPEALRNQIFEKMFLKAEIAKLSKEKRKEYDQSLKNLRDMNIILADREEKIKVLSKNVSVLSKNVAVLSKNNAAKDKSIAAKDKSIAAKDKSIAAKDARIAELERQLALKN